MDSDFGVIFVDFAGCGMTFQIKYLALCTGGYMFSILPLCRLSVSLHGAALFRTLGRMQASVQMPAPSPSPSPKADDDDDIDDDAGSAEGE